LANQNKLVKDGVSGERIGFEVDGTTLTVRDVIEGEELPLKADREPDLSPAFPELFPSPVDAGVSFEAESLTLPEYASIVVRDVDGDHVARLDETMELPRGSYCVEVNGVTKVLIRVTDAEITATGVGGTDPVSLSFDQLRTVSVGARSFHTRPEATITVPDDPARLANAVSLLGSSIKEFSPERSWPTLRGYPPRIELGDSFDVPSPLSVPDTGIEVVVRPTYEDVYRLSTLSYYLGARMVTGDAPAIRLDTGYEERLPAEGTVLEERVTELLRTWFLLDTLARAEGYVPSDRYEYTELGPDLHFYPPNLADRSMSERLMEYLEVNPEMVEPVLPKWPTEAVLRPVPAAAELLPHLANVLAPIRVRDASDSATSSAATAAATSPQALSDLSFPGASTSESGDGRPVIGEQPAAPHRVPLPGTEPMPEDTAALPAAAYENQIRRQTPERGAVAVAFLFESPDRVRAVRESLSDPAELDGVGSATVIGSPSPDTVAETLSDPSLDIVFCGAAVTAAVLASDRAPDIDEETGAPILTVFEGARRTAVGVGAVDRGGSCALLLDGEVSPDRARTLTGLLTAGSPLALAARLSLSDAGVGVRYVGDPAAVVAVDRGIPTQVYSCEARGDGSYAVACRSVLSTELPIGGEYRFTGVFRDSRSALIGTRIEAGETGVSGLLELHEEKAPILRFPDDIVFSSDDLTAEDVREMARKGGLSGSSQTSADGTRHCE
jgi:hypothetical protein